MLTGPQSAKLSDLIGQELSPPALDLIATDLGVNLNNLLPGASVKAWAFKLISELNRRLPPADGALLEKLRQLPNQTVSAAARALLQPTFLSPTGDPHDAIVLGRTAFVARDTLRRRLREFTNPNPYTTRVLIVRGEDPGGKSYTWEFLRHLAFSSVGAAARRLRLKGTNYTPREFLAQAYLLLLLDIATLPVLSDNPQLAKIDPLINAFKGRMDTLTQRYWLVIDDLNEPNVTPEIRETAYAIACAVEELKPDNLWVALLGYNETASDADLRHVALDDAEFPTAGFVAKHLELVAQVSGTPLDSTRAREIADVLFTKFPKVNKEAMSNLTVLVEEVGEKLRMGQQP